MDPGPVDDVVRVQVLEGEHELSRVEAYEVLVEDRLTTL